MGLAVCLTTTHNLFWSRHGEIISLCTRKFSTFCSYANL